MIARSLNGVNNADHRGQALRSYNESDPCYPPFLRTAKEFSSPVTADLIISLIGMPGSGKSTVGQALASHLALELVDADGLIEAQEAQTLQQIMDSQGNAAFRAIEEQVLTEMPLFPSVISTGGSVVYSEKIMARLAAASTVVYLRAQLPTIEYRVSLAPQRGIASNSDQTLKDLYEERVPLYERYAGIVVDCDSASPEEIAEHIAAHVS